MSDIEEVLVSLGFSHNEVKVYLTNLTMGEATAAEVAKVACLPRTYVYDLLRNLTEKGLATSVIRRNKIRYTSVNPQRIKRIFSQKLSNLEAILPSLANIYQRGAHQTKVRFFEGREGILAIHQELLEAKQIDVFGEDQEWVTNFPDWQDHVSKVVKSKIKVRELARQIPQTVEYNNLYTPLQEMRFTPQEWSFECNVLMWGNKVAFISHSNEMHGVIIESAPIVNTLRATFNIMWALAEPIQKDR